MEALHLILLLSFVSASCLLAVTASAAANLARQGISPVECPANETTWSVQQQALMQIYKQSGGPTWTFSSNWKNTSLACTQSLTYRNSSEKGQTVTLPPHCCWAGVSCCLKKNATDGDYVQCAQYQCNCVPGSVTGLSLGRNNLTGTLDHIFTNDTVNSLSCSLRMVFMGGNNISGSIPERMSEFEDLRILSLGSNGLSGTIPRTLNRLEFLEELDLGTNNLTGQVPSGLCGGASRISYLRDLILSNNQLTGTLSVPYCESLIYLDVQNNDLSGPLPDLSAYRQLHILRLGYNYFEGPVQFSAFDLRLLVVLDLSDNWLNGSIPNITSNGSQLTLVRLYQNNFTGQLPQDLFNTATLSSVQLFSNLLTGTLPANIGDARGLVSLMLYNNSLYGTIPDSLQLLAQTQGTFEVSRTNLSCCGYDPVPGLGYRYFNTDDSFPKLPKFLQLIPELARPVFDNNINSNFVAMRCPTIGLAPGYQPSSSGKVNTSTEDSSGEPTTLYNWNIDPEYYLYHGCYCLEGYNEVRIPHIPGVPSMGPRMICQRIQNPWYKTYPWAVVLIVLGGLLVALWLTWFMCFRRGKNAAIVQGCFNIRKRIQGEPVGGQVSIVVTDIEGYSDLMKQSPQLMTKALNLHNAIIRKSRWNNFGYTLEQEGDSYALVFYEAHDAVIFCLQTQLALNRQSWPEGLFTGEVREATTKRRQQAPSLLNAISVMTNNLTASLFGGRASLAAQHGSDDRGLSTSLALPSGMRPSQMSTDGTKPDSRQSSLAAQPTAGDFSALATPSAVGPGPGINKGHPVLFNGMRVRMGVATGILPPGSNSKGSAVMDLAKMVSDAANGGQIMICERTFKSIKERMEEFGAVDHNGMNFKKLNAIQPPWYACARRKHARNPDDALLLDMGEYTYCPGCKRLPLFQLEATPAGETPGVAGGVPPTPKGSGRRGGGKAPEGPLRLFQLVPPALVGRAKVFGNKVTVKDEWFCSDDPYFVAPGTLDAPLGPVDGPVLLPPITMAFLIADNGKVFASRHRRDTRRVNDVVVACVRACLRCVPGGYLCRMQDGDLKYMVAFSNPRAAVEWSLLLQDVLMYADWPEAALKFWREEYDDRGRLVFRGPRMKIGLCEGSPRSIIPDHIGRADYHGASINQAARYMDAAAHGGMVALETSLALKVMELWRLAAIMPPPPPPSEVTSAAGPSAAAAAATAGPSVAASLDRSGCGGGSGSGGGDPSGTGGDGGGGGRVRMAAVREADGSDEPLVKSRWSLKRLFQNTGAGAASKTDAPAGPSGSGHKGGPQQAQASTSAGAVSSPGVPATAIQGLGQALAAQGQAAGRGQEEIMEELPTFRHTVGTSDSGAVRADRAVAAAATAAIEEAGSASMYADEATLSTAAVATLRAAERQAANAAAAVNSSSSGATTTAAAAANSGTAAGPVAEGNEDAADAAASAPRPAAVAAATTAAAKVPNGSGSGAAAAAVAAAAAAAGHLDLLAAVESGPSMTSLTGSDNTMGPGTPPTLVLPPGEDGRTGSLTSDAATAVGITTSDSTIVIAAAPAGAALVEDAGGGKARRPSPLRPVPSPVISCDGSASASDGREESAAVAAAQRADPAGDMSLSRPIANAATRGSAPQLTALAEGAAAGAVPVAAGPNSGGGSSTHGRPPASALRHPPSAMRHSGSGLRAHVSFAGADSAASTAAASADNPAASASAAPQPSSASGAAASPPQPPPPVVSAFSTAAAAASGPPPLPFSAAQRAMSSAAVMPPALSSAASTSAASFASPPIRKALSSAPGAATATAAAAAVAAAGGGGTLSPASSIVRSPRPPTLALPSEKERDEALRAERAAVEASRTVSVDAPADVRYGVRVAAYRIGTFKFKGNPEPIPMAHITLDHLAGRRFPVDAPKGKGAKVGDAAGLVDECDTTLPDLAAVMRDRYMLSRAPLSCLPPNAAALDDARASPSGRRLRLLLGGGGGGGSSTGSGTHSPGSPGPSILGKSRSLGVRAHRAGDSGLGLPAAAGGGPGSDGGGGSPAAASTMRRGPNLMVQMVQQLASVSKRWASGSTQSREGTESGVTPTATIAESVAGSAAGDRDRPSGPGTASSAGGGAGGFGSVAGSVSVGLSPDPPAAARAAAERTRGSAGGMLGALLGGGPSSPAGARPASGSAREALTATATADPVRHSPGPSPLRFGSLAVPNAVPAAAAAGGGGAAGGTAGAAAVLAADPGGVKGDDKV